MRIVTRFFLQSFIASKNGQQIIKLILHEYQYPFLPKQILIHELIEPLQSIMLKKIIFLCPYLTKEMAQQCVDSLFAQLIFIYYNQLLINQDKEINISNSDMDNILEHIVSFTLAGIRYYEVIRG